MTLRVDLIDIKKVDSNIKASLLEWRNSDFIKYYSASDANISEEQHFEWISSAENCDNLKVFIVYFKNNAVGCVNLSNIDNFHKTAEFSFYLYPEKYTKIGLGAVIEYKIHEYAFVELGLEKLNIRVLENNPKVIQMHQKFGYKIEGILRKNIFKKGHRLDIYLMGIFKEEWDQAKKKLRIKINNEKQ